MICNYLLKSPFGSRQYCNNNNNSGLFVNAKSINVFDADVIRVGSLINCTNCKVPASSASLFVWTLALLLIRRDSVEITNQNNFSVFLESILVIKSS
jgi:hypothetical protein